MKTITRIITGVFWVMLLLTTTSAMAQWTTVKVHIQDSDIRNVSGQSFQDYKGLSGGQFEIVAQVEAVKDKGKVKFMLRTQSVDMVKYYMYTYRPGLKMKNCSYGKLQEHNIKLDFSPNEIGVAPFEQVMRSASATFDVEITFIVKDGKYGIAGFGSEKGWGYRATRIFKNVKGNGVFWADEPLETTYPIEEIKILNNPKLVSFQINDSSIQTAILDFVKKRNQEAEDECKGKTKENEDDNKKKDEEGKKAEASAKEIEAMKSKLLNQINITSSIIKTNKSEEDDFWHGGEEKSKTTTTTKPSSLNITSDKKAEIVKYINDLYIKTYYYHNGKVESVTLDGKQLVVKAVGGFIEKHEIMRYKIIEIDKTVTSGYFVRWKEDHRYSGNLFSFVSTEEDANGLKVAVEQLKEILKNE